MMFRKLTMITAFAATLAFPAVALAAHGGHGGGGHGGGGHGGGGWHGGGGHGGGGWHGGGVHGGGWHGGGVARRRLARRWLARWRRRATILGWPLVALRRWPVLAVVLRHLELGLLVRRTGFAADA